jgi:DNA-binding transcriptional LysR family regulator
VELRQLEYFVAVVEESNFTRAAARVHISQSGVSAQIRALEHEPGAQLIDRSGRTATLTAAGEAALGHARSALASARAVRTAVDEVNGLVRGRLAVGTVASCTFEPLFDALASFHAEHPGVEVTLVEDSSDRLLDQVRSGVLEIALVGMPASGTAAPASLTPSMLPTPAVTTPAVTTPAERMPVMRMPVISEPLVAAVAPTHPLASRASLRLSDLEPYPVACLPVGTGVRAVFDQACQEATRTASAPRSSRSGRRW